MTPGEVKGYLRQLTMRKSLSAEEREAVKFALETVDLMLAVEPIVSKVVRETRRVGNSINSVKPTGPAGPADPNTGWTGDYVPPEGKGSK